MQFEVLLVVSLLSGMVFAAPPIRGRVVNGTDSDIAKWPYMVSLRRYDRHSCGGTAIHHQWVVTAAHCSQGAASTYSIRHSSTHADSGSTSGDVIPVAQIINHPGYNPFNRYIHDIALIRLSDPISLPHYIELPVPYIEYAHGTPAILIGWGVSQITNGQMENHLQEVDLIVFSDEECARRHSPAPPHPSNICGGVPEGGKGQCSGDSGGPLIVNGTHVGIVSWSVKPCTVFPYPGVYTKVSHYRDWIRKMSGV